MTTGIYQITNKVNGRFYIGKARDLQGRLSVHYSSLQGNRHQNKLLQEDWNIYGQQAFEFQIIDEIEDEAQATTKEQELLDTHFDYGNKCYNLQTAATGWTSKTKAKTRRVAIGSRVSVETRALLVALANGQSVGRLLDEIVKFYVDSQQKASSNE